MDEIGGCSLLIARAGPWRGGEDDPRVSEDRLPKPQSRRKMDYAPPEASAPFIPRNRKKVRTKNASQRTFASAIRSISRFLGKF